MTNPLPAGVDHAELRRLAEAAKTVRRDAIGRLDGKDSMRLWFAFVDAVSSPKTILALLNEIDALRAAPVLPDKGWRPDREAVARVIEAELVFCLTSEPDASVEIDNAGHVADAILALPDAPAEGAE